jgi:hypothetical protein
MPILTTSRTDFNFKGTYDKGEKTMLFYAFLDEQVLVCKEKDADDKTSHQYAIREDKKYGLMFWEHGGCWKQLHPNIRRAYSDYIAEKELFKNKQNEK